MAFLKKIAIAGLLSWATVCLILVLSVPFDRTTPAKDKANQVLGGIALGLPPGLIGIWLIRGMQADHRRKLAQARQQTEAHLRDLLFQEIKANHGEVTLLRLVMAANLPTEVVRDFLDRSAVEFNAVFETSSEGTIIYRFPH